MVEIVNSDKAKTKLEVGFIEKNILVSFWLSMRLSSPERSRAERRKSKWLGGREGLELS